MTRFVPPGPESRAGGARSRSGILIAVAAMLVLSACSGDGTEAEGAQTLRAAPTVEEASPTAAAEVAGGDAPDPVLVRVPEVGIESGLVPLGIQEEDGALAPPDFGIGGWWQGGPECGPEESGRPCVVAGHVSSVDGPDVFYSLVDTPVGAEVIVEREDGSEVVYEVTRVEQHPKDAFPTDDVYGETPGTTIRLVTCGGEFDRSARSHRDNIIVFAEMSSA